MSTLLRWLGDVEARSLSEVGGKGASLGELVRAGLPVPRGFCLTTQAYAAAAHAACITSLVAKLDTDPVEVAGQIRHALLNTPIPEEIAEPLVAAYGQVGRAVAVRSSATAEDLPHASFAGQHDTYLNVVGPDMLLDAVRGCWASLWTDRAVAYRSAMGIDHQEVRLAVVVQELVDAAVSGVAFTADPVTGRRGWTVVDASTGLGEAVVSGAVNPDHFVVDTASGQVIERRAGDKALVVKPAEGGGVTHEARAADSAPCLTDTQLIGVVRLAERASIHFGHPQDVEWVLASDGTVMLTQSRPMTTLYPLPTASDEVPRAYLCASVSWQGLTGPLTPMGLAGLRLASSSVARLCGIRLEDEIAGPKAFQSLGGRMFLDMSSAMRSFAGRKMLNRMLPLADSRAATVVNGLLDDSRFAMTKPSPLPLVRRALAVAIRYGIPLRVAEALIAPAAARRRIARIEKRLIRRTTARAGISPAERLSFAERAILDSVGPLLAKIVPITAAAMEQLRTAGRLLGDNATEQELQTTMRGLPGNVTTEMDAKLWQIAESVGAQRDLLTMHSPQELAQLYSSGRLPMSIQQAMREFLDTYGHRAVAESDLGMPRWRDDPSYLFGVIAGYLAVDSAQAMSFTDLSRDAEKMVEVLIGRAGKNARRVASALRRARALLGLREQAKFYNIFVLGQARAQIALAGRALAEAGQIDSADDIFFLDTREARSALDGAQVRQVIAARRAEYEREARRRYVPHVLLSDGTDPELSHAAADGDIAGTPVSAGVATGPARVILHPLGATLKPGEILVAPTTDPAWTPLFLTAAGLVLETGGVNSHGAVVAREYGIPAIVGVPGATERFTDGQILTVDGSAGTIQAEQ